MSNQDIRGNNTCSMFSSRQRGLNKDCVNNLNICYSKTIVNINFYLNFTNMFPLFITIF